MRSSSSNKSSKFSASQPASTVGTGSGATTSTKSRRSFSIVGSENKKKLFGKKNTDAKWNQKLDRKSSRGMIYENEELRLRTININAEVEKGQSDIRKLRRENEQLRREIWSLRDEYDRLDTILHRNTATPTTGNKNDDRQQIDDYYDDDDETQSEDGSNSCDSCCADQTLEDLATANQSNSNNESNNEDESVSFNAENPRNTSTKTNFDHLSMVSEEELQQIIPSGAIERNEENNITIGGNFMPSTAADSLPLNDLQSRIPPLSHFENIGYERIQMPAQHSSAAIMGTAGTSKDGKDLSGIGTAKNEISLKSEKKKHFFSPIHRKQLENSSVATERIKLSENSDVNTIISTGEIDTEILAQDFRMKKPDLYLTNALASGTKLQDYIPSYSKLNCDDNFQNNDGENLNAILFDIENLSRDLDRMQLQQQKSHYYSQECGLDDGSSSRDGKINEFKKPYKSEINLILRYDNDDDFLPDAQNLNDELLPPSLPPPQIDDSVAIFQKFLHSNQRKRIVSPRIDSTATTPMFGVETSNSIGFEAYNNIENCITANIPLPPPPPPPPIDFDLCKQKKSVNPLASGVGYVSECPEILSPDYVTTTPTIATNLKKSFDSPFALRKKFSEIACDEIFQEDESIIHLQDNALSILAPNNVMVADSGNSQTITTTTTTTMTATSSADIQIQERSKKQTIVTSAHPHSTTTTTTDSPTGMASARRRKSSSATVASTTEHSDSRSPKSRKGSHQQQQHSSDILAALTGGRRRASTSSQQRTTPILSHQRHHHHQHQHRDSTVTANSNSVKYADFSVASGSGIGTGKSSEFYGNNDAAATSAIPFESSSRESSASLSFKSRRKLSINSHTAGDRIPWCACWGNGCL